MRNKQEIIEEALLIQIEPETTRIDFFTSDDILIVAGIDRKAVSKLKEDYDNNRKEFFESIKF